MRKFNKCIILIILIIEVIIMTNYYVFADNSENEEFDFIQRVEYSDEFSKWIELSESEKLETIQPKIYDELNTPMIITNPHYQVNLIGSSLNSKFSLKDVINDNVAIRNQRDTEMCWAFASLSSLETNLAMNNYKSGRNLDRIYDYSERHMNYATSRAFANNGINEFGFNRTPASGGQWVLAENYLTSGQGAINESDMRFENNNNIIDISEIENKTVQTRLYDTVYFDNYNELTGTERTEAMNKIKQHIQDYGSVFASMHGGSSDSISYICYNNETGAKYCNDATVHGIDHAVSIIGWDDEYSVENFSENMRPSLKGAWIVRNSWGEQLEYDMIDVKTEVFNQYPDQCRGMGWNSASEIPDSFIEQALGYQIIDGKMIIPVGDNGYMYVSYEDCNIGETLYGVVKATDTVDYDYLYQYDELYPAVNIELKTPGTCICNVFEKKSSDTEYLTSVALTAAETYTCKVYVNPNGSGKSKEDLQLVPLQSGESETIGIGYHTLEFANPIEIKSNEFAVVVELQGTRSSIEVSTEGKLAEYPIFDYVKVEREKTFVSSSTNLDTCTWYDLGVLHAKSPALVNCDSCLKAFTVKDITDNSLDRIEVATPPTRTVYNEGEDFEKAGMMIKAIFKNNSTTILNDDDYGILYGTNLQVGQESVTITYMDKEVQQPITVVKKENPNEDPSDKPVDNPSDTHSDNPSDDKPSAEDNAVNSNFSNANCTLSNIKAYYYKDDSSKDYTIVDTQISKITRNLNNDTYEYYYYLSPKANLTNITDWVKIDESQTAGDKLVFKVDSRKIPNYDEVSKAKVLYIYIKETVTKGGNQSVLVTKGIKYEQGSAKIETFVDGAKTTEYEGSNPTGQEPKNNNPGNNNPGVNNNQNPSDGNNKPSTASPNKLPYTGSQLLIVGIILITIVGLVLFIRYEKLNKYVK